MKTTPLKRVSKKQAKELRLRDKVRMELAEIAQGYCMTCNKVALWPGLSLSHKTPLSQGGETSRENCLLECLTCHGNLRHGERWIR